MTTPNKKQIYQEAKRLYFQHEHRNGNRTSINPEYSELFESGFIGLAQTNLMSNPESLYGLAKTSKSVDCIGQVKLLDTDILTEILKTGLICSASKGHGKSNAIKIILSEILRQRLATVKIFDSALNWLFDFDLPYQLIGDKTTIQNVDNQIYDLTLIDDTTEINSLIRQIVSIDYHNHARMKLLANGKVLKWTVYVVEEAQNIISSSALNGYENRFWLKAISTGRNLGLSFIFLTQRLADVSAKAIERCGGYLFGKMLGDNDLRKLRHITNKQLSWLVKDLQIGQFYYYNGTTKLLQFPLYQKTKQPQPYKPKRSFRDWFNKWIYHRSG